MQQKDPHSPDIPDTVYFGVVRIPSLFEAMRVYFEDRPNELSTDDRDMMANFEGKFRMSLLKVIIPKPILSID